MVQSREGLQMTTSLLLISKLPPVHTNLEINDHSLGSVLQETMLSPPHPHSEGWPPELATDPSWRQLRPSDRRLCDRGQLGSMLCHAAAQRWGLGSHPPWEDRLKG